ncbi:hypothetical protein O3G_MSEX012202 [Manduca sexta]|uniref:Carboxylic ester hydrolase n=1 Tax=Manduca sexta TaxID=7130 RepID=A0A921ZMK5_MANSE|nr:hypothetical protein O3G_MSEX012202 [Manduca sexta]KAG6460767.1 hypothetical protein O3G_MSEX012202 [Manduca sexta]UXP71994.1 esterase [Manduca sexta]
MNLNLLILCTWCILNGSVDSLVNIFTPIVHTKQGRLRGLRSVVGQYRYYGIPYAVSERFRLPRSPPKWRGVFHATKRFGSCAQALNFLRLGSEDCLELDVYTPNQVKPGERLPVLVFLHGGAYYYGSKWQYDPEFLVTKNVIVVIINYRVGILGFLCLNNVANLGLKDQVAALKWIRENIAVFGGDPENVTISGQSAGASAAAMHLLSKSSKGLFHKAILMSGTPITPWAFNPEHKKPIFEDAAKFGRVGDEMNAFEIFNNSSVSDLLGNCQDTSINPRYFKYSPCIDNAFNEPFFHDTPYNTIKSGDFNKVPIINGFVDIEGMLFYGLNDDTTFKDLEDNFTDKLPSVFSWNSQEVKQDIARKFREHYFSNRRISKEQIRGVVDFYSDWMAYSTSDTFSKLMTKYSDKPVYNYMFSYVGDRNFAKFFFGSSTGLEGACHSDDIFYAFKPGGLPMVLSSRDKLFIDRFTTMLTNFMKFGNPTPQQTTLLPVLWPATTANNSLRMRLDHQLSVIETPTTHKGEFFLDMLCKHGFSGYVPCERSVHYGNTADVKL